ncbi:MAG: transferase [Proteobacteria bacterium]|nr:transferase [Pseudomonadota bacterium]
MATIYPGVDVGDNFSCGEYVVIGVQPDGHTGEPLPTQIGAGAIIRSHTVIYAGNVIGARFRTGHGVMVRECNHIGDDVSIGSHSVLEHHVDVGAGVRIHSNAFVPEYSVLAEDAWIGPNAVLTNARYPRSRGVKDRLAGPRIGRNAKVGANVTILPGVTVGQDALVGAGAVVVRDVPRGAVVVGNPARVIGSIDQLSVYDRDGLIESKQ